MKRDDPSHDDLLFKQIHGFVTAAMEGRVTNKQVQAFESVLSSDDRAMRLYHDYMTELVGLYWLSQDPAQVCPPATEQIDEINADAGFDLSALAELEASETPVQLTDLTERYKLERLKQEQNRHARLAITDDSPRDRVIVIPRALVYFATAAALLLAAFVGYQVVTSPPAGQVASSPNEPEPQRAVPAPPPVLAKLGTQLDAVWGDVGAVSRDTRGLLAGAYALDAGLAEIDLAGGSRVLIEGPADFELLSATRIRLTRGSIVGYCPAGSEGLTVLANQTRVIDLGTAFGVALDPSDQVSVQVYEGEVLVATGLDGPSDDVADNDAAHRMFAGQAAQVDPRNGQLKSLVFDSHAFATAANEQARALRAYGRAVRDASPLCYWPLDLNPAQAIGACVVPGQPDLSILGEPDVIRMGRRSFARFDGVPAGTAKVLYTNDRLTQLDGATEISVEAWVRPERYHRGTIFNFYDPGADSTFAFNEHISYLEFVGSPFEQEGENERNKISFWLDALGAAGQPGEAITDNPYMLGQWMHVVAILREGQMLLFVDSELVASRATAPAFQRAPAICFGTLAKELSNPIPRPGQTTRRLAGDLDEIAVYPYALPPDVIAEHHRRMRAVLEAEAGLIAD